MKLILFLFLVSCSSSKSKSDPYHAQGEDCKEPSGIFWWIPNVGKDCRVWKNPSDNKW